MYVLVKFIIPKKITVKKHYNYVFYKLSYSLFSLALFESRGTLIFDLIDNSRDGEFKLKL